MLFIFRKLRRSFFLPGKVRTYLAYAVGEILLIVIGIMIALQISDWNEQRKEDLTITDYAKSLIQDLEDDLSMIDKIQLQAAEIVSRIEGFGDYVRGKKIEDISNLKLFYFRLNKPHKPYEWNRATIDELKSSGFSGYIEDETLAEMIADYDAKTHHLDVDYINGKAQFEKCTDLAAQIVNNNYPNFFELRLKLLPFNNDREGKRGRS